MLDETNAILTTYIEYANVALPESPRENSSVPNSPVTTTEIVKVEPANN